VLAAPLAGHKRANIIFVSAQSFRTSLGEWHMGSLCRLINAFSGQSYLVVLFVLSDLA